LSKGRQAGAEAVSRTISAVGLDETPKLGYHRTNITLQLLKNSQPVLYRPSPDLDRSVSDERVAPNQCTRIATAAMGELTLLAKLLYHLTYLARPQSRNFKRWAAG